MKKCLCIFLILFLLLPSASWASEPYTPALGMTMDDFIMKYNALGAPFGSSLTGLTSPMFWTIQDGMNVAWFKTDNNTSTCIRLYTADPTFFIHSTAHGLDRIQIFINKPDDFLALISVGTRCVSLFAFDMFGTSMDSYFVGSILKHYYDNGPLSTDRFSYQQINSDQDYYLNFLYDGTYILEISRGMNR